mmetsp:Transcript_9622/g.34152  ORF Transcript_9622/g.34152 Transcript_9622/m.34152 type:complete len:343 (-) Transcript_9622:455-1483(-)
MRTMSSDSLFTIVFSTVHHSRGTVYLVALSVTSSYKVRMVGLSRSLSPPGPNTHPMCLSCGSSGLVFFQVGSVTDTSMQFSNPLMANTAKHLLAHGQAKDTYRWYRPGAALNLPPWAVTRSRNVEGVLLNAPLVSVSARAVLGPVALMLEWTTKQHSWSLSTPNAGLHEHSHENGATPTFRTGSRRHFQLSNAPATPKELQNGSKRVSEDVADGCGTCRRRTDRDESKETRRGSSDFYGSKRGILVGGRRCTGNWHRHGIGWVFSFGTVEEEPIQMHAHLLQRKTKLPILHKILIAKFVCGSSRAPSLQALSSQSPCVAWPCIRQTIHRILRRSQVRPSYPC